MKPLRVESHQVVMTEDYEYLYLGEPFTGSAYKLYEGMILHETDYEAGMKNGTARRWYPEQTQLYSELNYRNNTLHGIQNYWYENGQRKSLQLLDAGVLTKGVVWDQRGEVVGIFRISDQDWTSRLLAKQSPAPVSETSVAPSQAEQEIDGLTAQHEHLIGYWPL